MSHANDCFFLFQFEIEREEKERKSEKMKLIFTVRIHCNRMKDLIHRIHR